jgi:membrane associated rhomboid family serine protease
MPSSASSSSPSDAAGTQSEVAWDAPIPATRALVGALVAAHVGTALFQWAVGYEPLLPALLLGRSMRYRVAVGGQLHALVADGEIWRLWTSSLLHGDGLHLAVNAVAIGTLGRLLEPWIGGLRLLGWFFLGALGGAALSQLVGIVQSDGASGGAFALLGALMVVAWKRRATLDEHDRRLFGPVLGGFLALNLVLSFVLPFVNAAGHVGGLIAGLGLGLLWDRPRLGAIWWAWLALCAGMIGWGLVSVAG